jgi:hypothetical protein
MAGMSNEHHNPTAVVIANMPDGTPQTVTVASWKSFLSRIQNIELKPGGKMWIHQNAWQIPLNSGLNLLAKLHCYAEDNGIPLHVLILEELPTWTKYPPDAEKTV